MHPELTNRIKSFRKEHGMSQADLAAAVGVTQKTISTIESGRFTPSTVIALRIAAHFGVPVEEVFQLRAYGRNAEGSE
ncbi:MAG: helix-turn-helix transcriptional regulator [Thermoanaerobaculia bacterium]|nr:helix-turn-helix transcriptional regulator [Thermoanaerobaculia bacterium]